ncbi:MAG TPA: hypothetical protein DCS88_00670 [Alphaproteobacteria bacterium]|nr:hypothetical protein [Alphaproteobacteria bacterium]
MSGNFLLQKTKFKFYGNIPNPAGGDDLLDLRKSSSLFKLSIIYHTTDQYYSNIWEPSAA